jgi:hypothetical protein
MMDRSGYLISFRMIFGLVQTIAGRNHIMSSTVTKTLVLAALFAISAAAAAASSNQPPRFLSVPALGLRLPFDLLNLEPFPEDLRATCDQIADDEQHTGRMWIFGRAKDAASTYFVLTGYFKRRSPHPERRLYQIWDDGAVFTILGAKCGGDPHASETFNARDPNAENNGNVPIPILRELARDLATQTVRAFGGPDQLRAAIITQRIDLDTLSPELQDAFRPYFPAATR